MVKAYVLWFNTDPLEPYLHDIAPGESLGGFTLMSTLAISGQSPASLVAWNHADDAPGLTLLVNTLTPISTVPEPNSISLLGAGLVSSGLFILAYRRRKRHSDERHNPFFTET